MTLNNMEFDVLEKIARQTKMDCWFLIAQDENGDDYVYDLEEGCNISLREGVQMLHEGITCELSDVENEIFKQLLHKLNIN